MVISSALGEDGMLRLLKVNPKSTKKSPRLEVQRSPKRNQPLLEYPCWAAPVLAHGLLYVRGNDRLVCLELIPGRN